MSGAPCASSSTAKEDKGVFDLAELLVKCQRQLLWLVGVGVSYYRPGDLVWMWEGRGSRGGGCGGNRWVPARAVATTICSKSWIVQRENAACAGSGGSKNKVVIVAADILYPRNGMFAITDRRHRRKVCENALEQGYVTLSFSRPIALGLSLFL